jgi:predicted RNase H-like HicB family nuclease
MQMGWPGNHHSSFIGCSIGPRNTRLTHENLSAVVERCPSTGLLVGYVPGFPGAHSQAGTIEELHSSLHEVIEMLLEDGEPKLESDFVGLQQICITS